MDKDTIIKIIAAITIFISLLLALFLLTVKTKNKLSNRLLASFIVLCSIDILGLFISQYLNLFLFSKSFTLLIFPSFFLFVLSICSIGFKLKFKYFLHALPFGLYLLLFTFYLLATLFFDKPEFVLKAFYKIEWIFSSFLLKLQVLLYILASFLILRKHKKVYLENYAAGDIAIYKLLSQIIIIFIISLPVTVVKEIVHITNYYDTVKWLNIALVSIALLMLCLLVLKALYNPKLFRGVNLKLEPIDRLRQNKISEIDENDSQIVLIEKVRRHMIEREPYLEPSLTLQELSNQLNISPSKLSVLINSYIGQHFFDFVNEYRILKAVEILKDSSRNRFTVQQVLYDVGFNSKSSFNTAFKKQIGLTPTEFKKNRCKLVRL